MISKRFYCFAECNTNILLSTKRAFSSSARMKYTRYNKQKERLISKLHIALRIIQRYKQRKAKSPNPNH